MEAVQGGAFLCDFADSSTQRGSRSLLNPSADGRCQRRQPSAAVTFIRQAGGEQAGGLRAVLQEGRDRSKIRQLVHSRKGFLRLNSASPVQSCIPQARSLFRSIPFLGRILPVNC